MKKLSLILFIVIIHTSFSQTEKLEFENIPFINENFSKYSQFKLENKSYNYQFSQQKNCRIILNKDIFTYSILRGEDGVKIKGDINLEKSYQFLKDGKLMFISLYLENCSNGKLSGFKTNIKVHFVEVENQKYYIVDSQILKGEFRGLRHNLDSETIQNLVEEKKLVVKP
ncbi:hypothetical protein [Mesoflavibacter sp. CH_XMU1422-2]|uniref:hypothetical protein n=1 Tax=Mesoflavibacter sp. CH_XMU1422-2 TaxID=3107770 RepID=UPI003008B6C2